MTKKKKKKNLLTFSTIKFIVIYLFLFSLSIENRSKLWSQSGWIRVRAQNKCDLDVKLTLGKKPNLQPIKKWRFPSACFLGPAPSQSTESQLSGRRALDDGERHGYQIGEASEEISHFQLQILSKSKACIFVIFVTGWCHPRRPHHCICPLWDRIPFHFCSLKWIFDMLFWRHWLFGSRY